MTIFVASPDTAAEARTEPNCGGVEDGADLCPPWCTSHAELSEGIVSHTHLVASLFLGEASVQIAIVQHERREDDRADESAIYASVHSRAGLEITRLTPESSSLLSSILDATDRNRSRHSVMALLDLPALSALPKSMTVGDGAWIEPLARALREGHNTLLGCRRTPCPTWCQEEHGQPYDAQHSSEIYGVELSRYPYWVQNACHASSMLLALYQDPGDRAPVVGLTGPDDSRGDVLTLDEAEELAQALHQLVAMGRTALPEQPHEQA